MRQTGWIIVVGTSIGAMLGGAQQQPDDLASSACCMHFHNHGSGTLIVAHATGGHPWTISSGNSPSYPLASYNYSSGNGHYYPPPGSQEYGAQAPRGQNPLFAEQGGGGSSWFGTIFGYGSIGMTWELITSRLWNYIANNKRSLAWKGGVVTYLYVNYRLFRSITYLLDPDRWIYWHRELSLAQILDLSDDELLGELLAVSRVRNPQASRYENLVHVRSELMEEIAVFENYASWARRIMILDDIQARCGIACGSLCEGFKIFGLGIGSLIGCGVRALVQATSLKRIVYMHEGLVQTSPDALRRLYHLCRIVDEYLAHEIAPEAKARSVLERFFVRQYRGMEERLNNGGALAK